MARPGRSTPSSDASFMSLAVQQAILSEREGGIPIGAVLIREGKVIAEGHNRRVQSGNPILHAEMCCFQSLGRDISQATMSTLYSTLMPCLMCSGAAAQFGVGRVVVADDVTFPGGEDHLRLAGLEVEIIPVKECRERLQEYVDSHQEFWKGLPNPSRPRRMSDH